MIFNAFLQQISVYMYLPYMSCYCHRDTVIYVICQGHFSRKLHNIN